MATFTVRTAQKASENCRWMAPRPQSSTLWKMRRVFASVPFRCCPKISLRHCGTKQRSAMPFLRREGRHEPFVRGEREVRAFVHHQPRGQEGARPSHGEIVGRAAEQPWIDGYERRMWRRRVRLMLRLIGWHAGE